LIESRGGETLSGFLFAPRPAVAYVEGMTVEPKASPADIEPITIVLPTLKQSVQLPPEVAAQVWDAVKRGVASSPEEYIHQALERLLAGSKTHAEDDTEKSSSITP
jgi:hypothetical protein